MGNVHKAGRYKGQFLTVSSVFHESHLFKHPVILNTVDGALSNADPIGCCTSIL